MNPLSILLVEDEARLAESIKQGLVEEGASPSRPAEESAGKRRKK